MNHVELGALGEKAALAYLEKKGYQLIKANYRYHKYELDLVMLYNNMLVVVEVKTRQNREFGEPYEAVSRKKQKQIIQAASAFMQYYNRNEECRFDIVSIVTNIHETEIEHIENAFTT